MTKKEMAVGKTTLKYNINDFRDWLLEKWVINFEKGIDDTRIATALCFLNDFEKEVKNNGNINENK